MIRFLSWGPLALLALVPPEWTPTLPLCGFKFLTALPCPFCGLTHGLAYWMHGRWTEALGWHLLTPIPFLILLLYPFATKPPSGRISAGLAAMFLVYGALRCCGLVG